MNLTYGVFEAWLSSKPPSSRPCATRIPHKNLGCACPLEVFIHEAFGEAVNVSFGELWYTKQSILRTEVLPEWAESFRKLVDNPSEGSWDNQTAASMLEKLHRCQ